MDFKFEEATMSGIKLVMSITGVSGAGKTFTALKLAHELVQADLESEGLLEGKSPDEIQELVTDRRHVAILDTEYKSAKLYAKVMPFKYSHCPLAQHHPQNYIDAIKAAERQGFRVFIIDSFSAAWQGTGGALDLANGKFNNWKDVTPLQSRLIDAIRFSKMHIICTMLEHVSWVVEEEIVGSGSDQRKRSAPKQIGLAPVQRKDVVRLFDVSLKLDPDHNAEITKTRCIPLDGWKGYKPGKDLADILVAWLRGQDPYEYRPPMNILQLLEELEDGVTSLQQLEVYNSKVRNMYRHKELGDDDLRYLGQFRDQRKAALEDPKPEDKPEDTGTPDGDFDEDFAV